MAQGGEAASSEEFDEVEDFDAPIEPQPYLSNEEYLRHLDYEEAHEYPVVSDLEEHRRAAQERARGIFTAASQGFEARQRRHLESPREFAPPEPTGTIDYPEELPPETTEPTS